MSRQAQAIIERQAPEVLEAAIEVLRPLQKNFADQTKDEKDHPFTECALFADNIKDTGGDWQFNWHFKDQPYLDQGGSLDDFDFVQSPYDVTHALHSLTRYLKGEELTPELQYYPDTIGQYYPGEENIRSVALRFVIHYVGDISQPLHVTAAVDNTYREGDQGGNLEKIPIVNGVGDLHAIWDSVVYEWPGYPVMPISDKDWVMYTEAA